jgi:hypothetical protein
LWFRQINEDIGLAPQFVGDHRRRIEIVETKVTQTPRRCLDQRTEIAVAPKTFTLYFGSPA